ncbi:MAG TPA: TolC family protein [Gemmatimonadaceae bacterium]|nr:TolC family protein [Gemmatimonadaceae bacterium]
MPSRSRRLAAWPALLLLAVPSGAGAQALSFDQALAIARQRNERVLGAAASVERARADVAAARGRLLPEVGVAARHTRIDEAIAIDLEPIRGAMLALHPAVPPRAVPPFVARVQDDAFTTVTLNATLPVFTGGRLLAGVRAADAGVESAAALERSAVGEVATELAQRYFGLQLARESHRTRRATRESLAHHVERARSLERHGQIARAERLRAEVALAEAERELQQAARDEELARIALASTLSVDDVVVPTTPLFRVRALAPVDSFRALARLGHPALARLAAERRRAHAGVAAARGELLPAVGLFAQRELYTRDLTILQPTWAAGVQASLPLFQGGQRLARLGGARAQERQVALLLERAGRDVDLLVEQRYGQVERARDDLAVLETTRALAEESLRAQQLSFGAGLATSLDVVDAEQALARVRLGILKARHDADVALAGLLEAVGASARLTTYIDVDGDR